MTQGKKRHGCLTIYLYFFLFWDIYNFGLYLFAPDFALRNVPDAPGWLVPLNLLTSGLWIVWLLALLRWRKWGFWGAAATTAISFTFGLSVGVGLVLSLIGLTGLVLLFGVLQIGTSNKGWPQLE